MYIKKILISVVLLASCAGPAPKEVSSVKIQTRGSDAMAQEGRSSIKEERAYLTLFKTARLYFEPNESSEYVQFISAKEQADFDRALLKEAADLRRKKKMLLAKKKMRQAKEKAKANKRKKANRKKIKAAKKKRRKRWLRMSKKQRKKEIQRKKLKKKQKIEREKVKAERAERKKAERKIHAVSKRMKRDFPDGDIVSFFSMRKLQTKGNWVQVETISPIEDGRHCHQDAMKRIGGLKLRFWVKSSAISEVVSRSVRVDVARGAPIKLLPGLGILEDGGKKYIFVSGFRLPVDLHPDSIASEYRPVRGMEQAITDTVFSAKGIARGLRFGKVRLSVNPFFSKHVSQTLKIGAKHFAAFQSQCAEVFVRVEKGDIERAGPRGVMRFGGDDFENGDMIRSGSELYLPSGVSIGVALHDHAIKRRDAEGCFKLKIWRGRRGKRFVRVCSRDR